LLVWQWKKVAKEVNSVINYAFDMCYVRNKLGSMYFFVNFVTFFWHLPKLHHFYFEIPCSTTLTCPHNAIDPPQ